MFDNIDTFISSYENKIIDLDNQPALEGLFNIFNKKDRSEDIQTWYEKLFSGNSFTGVPTSPFHNVSIEDKYIYIYGINYKKLLSRIRSLYTEKSIDSIFIKKYNSRDVTRFNKKKISRSQMKIDFIKSPVFFALELITIFNDLYIKYREPAYGRIAKQLYSKSWVSKCDSLKIPDVPLQNLDNLTLELTDYQKEFIRDYNKLKAHLNLDGYILSFEQGMGKSLTAVALAECLNVDNIYIVCPNNVQENWMLEIRKYYDKYSNDEELWRKEVVMCGNKSADKTAKFFIINNESISKIYPFIKSGNNLLVIDESHNFRNNTGTRVGDLLELKKRLSPQNVLAMSGTPIKASPNELVPMMRLIDSLFTEEAAMLYNKCFKLDTTLAMNIIQNRFGKIIYRRTKAQHKSTLALPEKKTDSLNLKIANPSDYLLQNVRDAVVEKFNYIYSERLKENSSLRQEFVSLVKQYSTSSKADVDKYINWIIKTVNTGRSMAMHELDLEFVNSYLETYVLPSIKDKTIRERMIWLNTNFIKMEHSSMGKAIGEILPARRRQMFISIYDENIDTILELITSNPEKTIIFSQIKGVIDHINDSLNENGVRSVKITGDVKDRMSALMQFKEDDETIVLCATSQSLGTGVTLVEASQMIFFGTPWRSADFEQCTDRIHRIGQTVDVMIYTALLDTDTKNLSSRMEDILNWSNDMYTTSIGQLSNEKDTNVIDIYANESEGNNVIDSFIIACESKLIDTTRMELTSIPEADETHPIFILLTYTDTLMAKIIKFHTKEPYSHASITFDPSLTDVYSFGRKFKDSPKTFINENIHEGLFKDVAEAGDASYSLYVTFVTDEQHRAMKEKLNEFKKRGNNLKFSFRGLINIARGKETHIDNEYFCSQFVAEILKAGNDGLINRDTSLYTPSQLRKIKNVNFVCRGKLSNYNPAVATASVEKIKMKYKK